MHECFFDGYKLNNYFFKLCPCVRPNICSLVPIPMSLLLIKITENSRNSFYILLYYASQDTLYWFP